MVTPAGESPPYHLLVNDGTPLAAEREPNNGFEQAQPIQVPQVLDGAISQPQDVDVFTFAHHLLGMGDALITQLGDVHQSFHPGLELGERPKLGQFRDLGRHRIADVVLGFDARPTRENRRGSGGARRRAAS